VSVYSTLPLWFIYYESSDCGAIQLTPRTTADNIKNVDRPRRGDELELFPGKYFYDVDLGHPLVRITADTLRDPEQLRRTKQRLRIAIYFSRLSHMHKELGVPHFYWFAETAPDTSKATPAFYYQAVPDVREAQDQIYGEIAPTLVSLAMLYGAKNDKVKLAAVAELLKAVPPKAIPDLIMHNLRGVFQ
jgi:hypothetical protein